MTALPAISSMLLSAQMCHLRHNALYRLGLQACKGAQARDAALYTACKLAGMRKDARKKRAHPCMDRADVLLAEDSRGRCTAAKQEFLQVCGLHSTYTLLVNL